ncbi:MAG TPA: hypothetical protein VF290_13940 [Pyrinomonadaceae bacterium]
MEIIGELLLQLILEVLLQVLGELLAEVGLRSFAEPFVKREERNPILAGIGYCLLGLIFGGLSLLIFPDAIVRSERFHGINLLITPVLAGLAMSAFGHLLKRQGKTLIRLDSFIYGFLFAFMMALVRFVFTS